MIVHGLQAREVWPRLLVPERWPTYYANSSDPGFHDGSGPELSEGARFRFETFGFPVEARCIEHVAPAAGRPGRLAWHGWAGEVQSESRLDVHHAWLIEDLPGGRVRILTQETQKGKPAEALHRTRPNPMLNGHQEWLDGLLKAAFLGGTGNIRAAHIAE